MNDLLSNLSDVAAFLDGLPKGAKQAKALAKVREAAEQASHLAEGCRNAGEMLAEIAKGDVPGPYGDVFEAVRRHASGGAERAREALAMAHGTVT